MTSDGCFLRYRDLVKHRNLKKFDSAEQAEEDGYFRKPIGWAEEKKYADICSPLYDYVLSSESKCKITVFENTKEAELKGYSPIEGSNRNLLGVPVVGIELTKVYLTPCDQDYSCLLGQESNKSNECSKLVSTTGEVRIFPTEDQARRGGFISQQEYYLSEMGE